MCACVHTLTYKWSSEDSLWKPVLSLYHTVVQIQVASFGATCLYLLSLSEASFQHILESSFQH